MQPRVVLRDSPVSIISAPSRCSCKRRAQGGDVTADAQPVSTAPTTTDAVEAAPAGEPIAEAAGAPDTAAVPNGETPAAPDGDAVATAAPEARQSGFDVQPTAEQTAAEGAPAGLDQAAAQAAAAQAAATASALTQNAGALEQMLQIPGSMVGKLIGKQGETIKGLQYSTNTRIQACCCFLPSCCRKASFWGVQCHTRRDKPRRCCRYNGKHVRCPSKMQPFVSAAFHILSFLSFFQLDTCHTLHAPCRSTTRRRAT